MVFFKPSPKETSAESTRAIKNFRLCSRKIRSFLLVKKLRPTLTGGRLNTREKDGDSFKSWWNDAGKRWGTKREEKHHSSCSLSLKSFYVTSIYFSLFEIQRQFGRWVFPTKSMWFPRWFVRSKSLKTTQNQAPGNSLDRWFLMFRSPKRRPQFLFGLQKFPKHFGDTKMSCWLFGGPQLSLLASKLAEQDDTIGCVTKRRQQKTPKSWREPTKETVGICPPRRICKRRCGMLVNVVFCQPWIL